MGVHAPELLILYALDMFLVLSIVTVLFDSNFPVAVPYFFQLISIAGTGHMYVSRVFDEMFTLDSRFWYSFFYLDVMILSAFAVTAYLLFLKKSVSKGFMFLGGFSLPSTCFGFYIVTFYGDYQSVPWVFGVINGSLIGVMMLISVIFFTSGAMLFMDVDPGFIRFKYIYRRLLRVLLRENEKVEHEKELVDVDGFNPVDHVHVTTYVDIDQEEYPQRS